MRRGADDIVGRLDVVVGGVCETGGVGGIADVVDAASELDSAGVVAVVGAEEVVAWAGTAGGGRAIAAPGGPRAAVFWGGTCSAVREAGRVDAEFRGLSTAAGPEALVPLELVIGRMDDEGGVTPLETDEVGIGGSIGRRGVMTETCESPAAIRLGLGLLFEAPGNPEGVFTGDGLAATIMSKSASSAADSDLR
jgi:hypothetical protein